MIPKDPVVLLSFMNMKLRDNYKDLQALCEDLEVDEADVTHKLALLDYHYDKERNQFV